MTPDLGGAGRGERIPGHTTMGPGPEFDLIRRMLALWGEMATGVGNDVAALEVPPGERLVVTTDVSVENVHFRREWLSPREIGYRATAAAVSDLAAAGAAPLGLLVTLQLPERWLPAALEIAAGVGEGAAAAGCRILGGDLSAGTELAIGVTALGSSRRPLTRDGASVGEVVVVTGELGLSGLALGKLQRGLPLGPRERERFAHPIARIAAGQWLAANGASAAVDISDGLASDLRHLALASGVRIEVDVQTLPLPPGVRSSDALRSGEEYEVVATIPSRLLTALGSAVPGTLLTPIGRVVAGPPDVVFLDEGEPIVSRDGFSHFQS